jgi:hypothetical protein
LLAQGAISFSPTAATFSGNVGIGDTTFAAGKLQVYDSSGNHVWLKGRASDGTSSVSFRNNADNTYNGRIQVADTGGMSFQVAGSTRATIDASGNVGIGTSSPSAYTGYATLALNGSSGGELDLMVGGTNKGALFSSASSIVLQSTSGSNLPLVFRTNSVERMRLDSSGNLLVGKTTTTFGTEGYCV